MFLQEVLAFPEWKESVLVAEAEAIAAQDSKVSEADGASSHVQGAEASSGTIELVPAHTRVKCDEGEEVSDSIDASSGEAVPVEAGLVPDGIAHATAPATVQATRRRGVMSATSALPASAAAHANTIAPQEERPAGRKTRRRRPEGRRAEGRDGPKDQVSTLFAKLDSEARRQWEAESLEFVKRDLQRLKQKVQRRYRAAVRIQRAVREQSSEQSRESALHPQPSEAGL